MAGKGAWRPKCRSKNVRNSLGKKKKGSKRLKKNLSGNLPGTRDDVGKLGGGPGGKSYPGGKDFRRKELLR